MSELLKEIIRLAESGQLRISEHGYDELAEDGLSAREIVAGLAHCVVVEEYPDYPKALAFQYCSKTTLEGRFTLFGGVPKGRTSPAVLVTAYRPDPKRWDPKFLKRLES